MTQGRPGKLEVNLPPVSDNRQDRKWHEIAAQRGKEVLGLEVSPNAQASRGFGEVDQIDRRAPFRNSVRVSFRPKHVPENIFPVGGNVNRRPW
jgi:hypothetical protein